MPFYCAVLLALPTLLPGSSLGEETASIGGRVVGADGNGVASARVELSSEGSRIPGRSTSADESGDYKFLNVASGRYSLQISSRGFQQLALGPIEVAPGENRLIPPVTLPIGELAKCSDSPVVTSIRLLSSGVHLGALRGRVGVEPSPGKPGNPKAANVTVNLMSLNGQVVGTARTDLGGEFELESIPPGFYRVVIGHPGFYAYDWLGVMIQGGYVVTYSQVQLGRCRDRSCDPRRRPRKPRATCE